MLQVEMSKDIREYEPRIIGPFTKRQSLLIVIGVVISTSIAFILPIPSFYIKLIIASCGVFPFVMCGWIDMQGMHFEQFLLYILKNSILTPSIRRYKSENAYRAAVEAEDAAEQPQKKQKKKRRKKYPRKYKPYD